MDTNTAPETAVTVNAILARYERECLHELRPTTAKGYRRHIKQLLPLFGHYVASELEPRHFADFLNVRRGQVERVRALAVLSAALTKAVRRWFWLKTNVLRDVERPKSKPRDRLVSDTEFEAFKAQVPKRLQMSIMLAALTGQRQGDIIRFRWSDIRDNALYVQQGKTRKRIAIEISAGLEEVLDGCWLLEGGGHAGSQYILPTHTGRPYTSEGFRACWQRAMRKWMQLGNENFHFHDLRALAATKCATPEIAMRLLGHTTLAMTMRVYRRGIERVSAL